MKPKVLVLRAPGTNCDAETAYAFELAGAVAERWHVNRVLENPASLREFQVLCFPGGFSYGDDISAGRILGNQVRLRLTDAMREFQAAGKLILGICNGFQILMKTGLLFSERASPRETASVPTGGNGAGSFEGQPDLATLAWNDVGTYQARWARLRVVGQRCVFFQGVETMYLPVAHAEGKFIPRDQRAFESLDRDERLPLKYFPEDNPNGAVGNVAAMCDASGRVCGLMPHPERHIDRTQHPRWTRGEGHAVGDGMRVFVNATRYFG